MTKVAAYVMHGNGLAKRVVPMLATGIRATGDDVQLFSDDQFRPEHVEKFDAAIFWGYVLTLQSVMHCFNEAKKPAVYLDLAYWERGTHYKVSVGSRHPTAYFQRVKHPSDRRERFKIEPQPYHKKGTHILVAGLSVKGAWAEKEGPWGQYETNMVGSLRKFTDRPIIYRAKSRDPNTKGIPGTRRSLLNEPLAPLLRDAWAVCTRHSNVAVDGLVVGIPAFAFYGVASVMARQDLSMIEKPRYPEGREQFLNDVAYCQWSEDELKSGACWNHLRNEGLVK